MFNYLSDTVNSFRTAAINFLFPENNDPQRTAQLNNFQTLRDYFSGRQRAQLTIKPLQADDNIIVNFIGLVVDRSISLLLGNGITFDLPGEDDAPEADYVDSVWTANKQGILLHKAAQLAGVYGTGYLKIVPNSLNVKGMLYPRLIALHPAQVEIVTDPEDIETVNQYIIRYVTTVEGKDVAHKEVTERIKASQQTAEGEVVQVDETAYWTVTHYISSQGSGGKWVVQNTYDWEYVFPPIQHWQNLPNAEWAYGKSDIEDVLGIQDRFNFVDSNISKIIRYHAHPKTWARGIGAASKQSWGADEMVIVNGQDAMVNNLEMQTDLASSRAFALDLRQALFDITRTVDLSSLADKLGALTNFGLRVLYMDALNKNGTKRELIGDALTELNRRLLVLNGMSEEEADGGEIVWPEALPIDDLAQSQALVSDINAGLVSKQTASGERGYDWAQEEERMQAQQSSSDNVGAAILRAFSNGQGANTGGAVTPAPMTPTPPMMGGTA